jgi:hypothetical protein
MDMHAPNRAGVTESERALVNSIGLPCWGMAERGIVGGVGHETTSQAGCQRLGWIGHQDAGTLGILKDGAADTWVLKGSLFLRGTILRCDSVCLIRASSIDEASRRAGPVR